MQTHATRSLLDPPGCLKTVTGLAPRAFCCRNVLRSFAHQRSDRFAIASLPPSHPHSFVQC